MATGNAIILFRTYNDIDHLGPVLWKMVKTRRPARGILIDHNSNLDLRDPLPAFLTKEGCDIRYFYAMAGGFRLPNRLLGSPVNPLRVKLLRMVFGFLRACVWTDRWAENVLEKACASVLVVDSHGPDRKSIEGKFIFAAKKMGIPVICLPHGPNVLTNVHRAAAGSKPVRTETVAPGYDLYDRIVAQSPLERPHWDAARFDGAKIAVLGSSRYCPEWMRVSEASRASYKPSKPEGGRLKVVFFLPHWRTYMDKEGTLSAIRAIAADDSFFMVVKEHTREGAGSLPDALREEYRRRANTEVIESARSVTFGRWLRSGLSAGKDMLLADSSALVAWADAVVCFGSSIGMEAVCRGKTLVNPAYLSHYVNLYETSGASVTVAGEKELVDALKQAAAGRPSYSTQAFEREMIFGGREEHDVLESFCRLMESPR